METFNVEIINAISTAVASIAAVISTVLAAKSTETTSNTCAKKKLWDKNLQI